MVPGLGRRARARQAARTRPIAFWSENREGGPFPAQLSETIARTMKQRKQRRGGGAEDGEDCGPDRVQRGRDPSRYERMGAA
jgi:hypothetical protein